MRGSLDFAWLPSSSLALHFSMEYNYFSSIQKDEDKEASKYNFSLGDYALGFSYYFLLPGLYLYPQIRYSIGASDKSHHKNSFLYRIMEENTWPSGQPAFGISLGKEFFFNGWTSGIALYYVMDKFKVERDKGKEERSATSGQLGFAFTIGID